MNADDTRSAINVFARAQWAVQFAAVLGVVAMLCYPGGTVLDRNTLRYRITENFLSDLGMTVAYDGQPNRIGAVLFVAALGTLILGLGSATLWFIRMYSNTPASRNLAWSAGVVGLAVSLSFVGVAFTPENAAMDLHVQFTLFAFRIFPLSSVLMLLAAWKSSIASPRVISTWLVASLSLIVYAAFLSLGPSPTTSNGLIVSVIAQKSITVTILAALTYLCRETARTLRVPPNTRPLLSGS